MKLFNREAPIFKRFEAKETKNSNNKRNKKRGRRVADDRCALAHAPDWPSAGQMFTAQPTHGADYGRFITVLATISSAAARNSSGVDEILFPFLMQI